MKYVNHDTAAMDDEKLAELLIVHGYEGYGLFWAILEKLGKQEKPIKTIVLKKQLKVGKKLEKCWSFLETIGLISSNNGETFNEQLLKYAGKYKVSSEKTAKRVAEWRERQRDTENVTRYESVRNAPKVNKSKVKESEGEESERYTPALTAAPAFHFPGKPLPEDVPVIPQLNIKTIRERQYQLGHGLISDDDVLAYWETWLPNEATGSKHYQDPADIYSKFFYHCGKNKIIPKPKEELKPVKQSHVQTADKAAIASKYT